jgi:hypothetical protein
VRERVPAGAGEKEAEAEASCLSNSPSSHTRQTSHQPVM